MNDTEQITIYAPNGGVYLSDGSTGDNTTFPLTDQCERSATLMGDDYVRLVFFSNKYVAFDAYSYIEYDGQTFFMPERYTPLPNGEATLSNGEVQVGGYKYDCKFISVGNMLKKYTCYRHVVINTSPRSEFDEPEINISGNLQTLYSIIITSIQRAVARIPDCHFRDMLQSLVTNCWDGSVNAPTSIVRLTEGDELDTYSFSGMNIADVCTQVCKSLTQNDHDTEWWIEEHHDAIEGLVLHMAKCQDTDANEILQLSTYWSENTGTDKNLHPYLSGGLVSCKYENEVSGIEQIVTPYGATRNMSALWTTGTDLVTNMIVTYGKRLRLDPNTTYKVYRKEDKATQNNPVYITTDEHGAIENDTVNTGIETSKFYDDIYPQCHFQITEVQVKEKHKSGITYTVPEYTCTAEVVDSLNYDTRGNAIDRDWLAANGFYPIMIEAGQTLSVRFESGFLNGREFEIANKTRKDEGAATYSMKFTIVATGSAENGDLIPSGNFRPQVGDQFALFNMKMPLEFIALAKQQLAQRAYEELVELQETRPAVKCKTEPYAFRNMSVHLGQLMKIESETFGKREADSATASNNYIPYSNTFRDHTCITSKETYPLSYKTKRTVQEWGCVQDATQVHANNYIIFTFNSEHGVNLSLGTYTFSIYIKNVGENSVMLMSGYTGRILAAGFSGRVPITINAASSITVTFRGADINLILWRMKLEQNTVATDWKPFSAYEYAPIFQSRCTAYSFKLSNPHEVEFKLASAVVQGVISSMQSAIADMNIVATGLEQRTNNLSRRGWHDAAEVSDMIDSIEAEMMLVGNPINQFDFESAISIINTKEGVHIGYGKLEHTQEPFVTNNNRGIWYISAQDLLCDCEEADLDDNLAYYLYVECNNDTQVATPMLVPQGSDRALNYADETLESGYPAHFLLGVLSSVFENERVFNRTNGFTAVEGGTITTEQIQDPNRNLIIDFKNGRIIARDKATISGNIVYRLENDEQFNAAMERLGIVEEFTENFEIGGRNYVLKSDTEISTSGAAVGERKTFDFSFETDGILQKIRGKKVTLSIQVEMDNAVAGASGTFKRVGFEPCIVYKDGSTQYLRLWKTLTAEPMNMNERISETFEIEDKEIDYLSQRGMYIQNVASGTIKLSRPKWEFGTVATDWTPAPEDVEAEIVENRNYVESIEQNLQNQIDGVVDSYFMKGKPTMENRPVMDWIIAEDDLARHEGDTYTNIQNYKGLDITQWEQGRVYFGNDTIGKTLDECKSSSSISVHEQGVRCKDLIPYEDGDTLLINTNGGEYDILVTYFGANSALDSTIVQKAGTYYSASSYATAQEIVLNADYSLCNVSLRKSASITPEITRDLGLCINPMAGHSWRFCSYEDDNLETWHWHEIADSDAVLALQKAATAQDTADGKRRVFSTAAGSLPTPPYDTGDLWANATYPANGATYDNVLLKCVVSRTQGAAAAITDWVDSSRAITAADAARERADAARQILSDMASDNKLTPQEKLDIEREWVEIQSEYIKNRAQAVTYEVPTANYDSAYNALKAYLVGAGAGAQGLIGIGGAVNNTLMEQTSDIVSTTFNSKFKDYYDANIDILNAISDAINAKAGESGQNLIGEANPYIIEAETTNNYNWWALVGKFSINSPRGTAVNQTWLENGKEYTFSVDKVQNLGSTANKFYAGLYNNNSTQLQTFDIKEGRQTYKFTVPSDGTNWGFIIYPAESGSTAGKGAIFTNLALYEGSHSPDFHKEYIKHLTDALHGTTEVSGGMVMTNVMMLKGTDGNTRAGMSGLEDDNILLWADADADKGSYQNALAKAGKNLENIDNTDITTLIKKDGTAKIGIFRIGTDKAVVSVPGQGYVVFDVTNGVSIRNTSNKEKVLVTPKSISSYKPADAIIDKQYTYNAKSLYATISDNYNLLFQFTISEPSTLTFSSLQALCLDVRGSITGQTNIASMSAKIQFVLYRSSGTKYYESSKYMFTTALSDGANRGTFNYETSSPSMPFPAGTYKMYLVLSDVIGNCAGYYNVQGAMTGSVLGSAVMSIIPTTEPKTVIGIDGLLTVKDALQYFMVDNSGSTQKIITKGLSTTKTGAEDGELYVTGGFVDAFYNLCKELQTVFDDVRFVGNNANHQQVAHNQLQNVMDSLKDSAGNRIANIIASS